MSFSIQSSLFGSSKAGRFGNQFFQLLFFYIISEKLNCTIRLPAWNGQSIFENHHFADPLQVDNIYNLESVYSRTEGPEFTINILNSLLNISPDNLDIIGSFQFNTETLFKFRHILVRKFVYSNISNSIKLHLHELKKNSTLICIHWREGDYNDFNNEHPFFWKPDFSSLLIEINKLIDLSGSNSIVINPSSGSILTNTLQTTGTGTTATGSGVGQIYLNGGTSNLIEYNANGIAAPTTGTRSVGTKIVLWPQIYDSGNTDYAIGISSLSLWHSVPSSSYAGTPTAFRWYAGTINIATLTGTGTFSTNGNVIAFASDKRLKTNIKPIENPLDKVKLLNGFTYNWNDKAKTLANYDTEESLVGVFAQEIQEVLPEAVKLAPFDNDTTGNSISGENYLTVQYEKIVPLLIEAIKDQQKQIDELKSKIK